MGRQMLHISLWADTATGFRVVLPVLCRVALFALFSGSTVTAKRIDVWLAAGQSNMVGSGRIEDLPAGFDYTIGEVLYSDDTGEAPLEGLGPLQPRLTRNNGIRRWFGPELTFGAALAAEPGNHAILKYARNGSPLITKWAPDGTALLGFYDHVDGGLRDLRDAGWDPRIAGMIWVQGTGDSYQLGPAEQYGENLTVLVDGIRERFALPEMKFVFNQLHAGATPLIYRSEVRQGQAAFAAADPNAIMVSVDDLPLKSDNFHLSSEALQTLGYRLAAAAIPEPAGVVTAGLIATVVVTRRRRS